MDNRTGEDGLEVVDGSGDVEGDGEAHGPGDFFVFEGDDFGLDLLLGDGNGERKGGFNRNFVCVKVLVLEKTTSGVSSMKNDGIVGDDVFVKFKFGVRVEGMLEITSIFPLEDEGGAIGRFNECEAVTF